MTSKVDYIMHTTENCPWCLKAKALFEYYGVTYQAKYEKSPDWDTFPAIYKVDDETMELIGGFNELVTFSFDHGL